MTRSLQCVQTGGRGQQKPLREEGLVGVDCQTVESKADTLVPAYSEARRHCVFQQDLLLFSCAGAHPSLQRICPCRDYMKGQARRP
ncbi:hypothetical protein CRUP_033682 [Coryphaenoides rupestris]|nr:hypothetical protein CRUP_033682 [Coryphaenoides rupestris]